VHEHDAHQFRLTHLRKKPGITLWSLQNKDAARLCLPIKRVVRIRSVSDIERLREGDYGLPTVSDFPFLDAVMIPHYLFQDTVPKDSYPSVAKVPEIVEALKKHTKGSGSVVWVNTLATEDFDEFERSGDAAMKPFSQWKARMEAHTDDVAVVTVLSVVTAPDSRKRKRRSHAVDVEMNEEVEREVNTTKPSKKKL
jgi:hypothetical protein